MEASEGAEVQLLARRPKLCNRIGCLGKTSNSFSYEVLTEDSTVSFSSMLIFNDNN